MSGLVGPTGKPLVAEPTKDDLFNKPLEKITEAEADRLIAIMLYDEEQPTLAPITEGRVVLSPKGAWDYTLPTGGAAPLWRPLPFTRMAESILAIPMLMETKGWGYSLTRDSGTFEVFFYPSPEYCGDNLELVKMYKPKIMAARFQASFPTVLAAIAALRAGLPELPPPSIEDYHEAEMGPSGPEAPA